MLWVLLLLIQQTDHTDVVRTAKAAVLAAGINPDAPAQDECARWEITRRTALLLANERAGLLDKPTGNNCKDFAVDIIAYPDGTIVDILGSGREGPNTPQWLVNPNKVDPTRWRAAPALEESTPTLPNLQPISSTPDFTSMDVKLERILFLLDQLQQQQKADTEKLQIQIDTVVKNAEKSATPLILKILSLGIAR